MLQLQVYMGNEGPFQRIPQSVRKEAREVLEDTGTEINYAELTWSNRQILCDSLQNNLDAETRKFTVSLEQKHITNRDACLLQAEENAEYREAYLDTLYLIYTLTVRAGQLHPVEKERLIRTITQKAERSNIQLKDIDNEHFKESHTPQLPVITYAVKDKATGKIFRGLTADDLIHGDYYDSDQFALFEWKVEDTGSGYDATKSVLYLPTKKGERTQRGMFGEGLKVNQAAIARTPGVNLRIYSQFEKEDGSATAWVRHVYPEDTIVMQRGWEVDQRIADETGSGTTIRFVDFLNENADLREVLDPRFTSVGEVASEYGEHNFSYPLGVTADGSVQPGINLRTEANEQYLQGLRIGTSNDTLLFSYDFQNRDIIAGRDRNHLQPQVMRKTVKNFWREIRDPDLYRNFLYAVLLTDKRPHAPEREAFFEACKRLSTNLGSEQDEILFTNLVLVLGLRTDIPNYVTTQSDRRLDHLSAESANIIKLPMSCEKEELELLRELLLLRCPDYTFIAPEEIIPEKRPPQEVVKTETEKPFSIEQKKFIEDLDQLYGASLQAFAPLRIECSQSRGGRAVLPIITYKHLTHGNNIQFYVESEALQQQIMCFIPDKVSGKASLPDLADQQVREEYTAKLLELQLAAMQLGRGYFYSIDRAYKEFAQKAAQGLLDTPSSHDQLDDSDRERLQILYHKAEVLQEQQLRGREQTKLTEALTAELQSYRLESYQLDITPERIQEIMRWCRIHNNVGGAFILRRKLGRRVLVENQTVTFVEEADQNEEIRQVPLTEQNRVGEWHGYTEYKISRDRYVIPVETPNQAVLKTSTHDLLAVCGGLGVEINTKEHEVKSVVDMGGGDVRIDKNCIISPYSFSENQVGYNYFAIPQSRDPQEGAIDTGIVKSPVTLEYISDHWSDPVRIFQDLGQNHMDAGGFHERFLVMDEGEKRWVSRDELGQSHILGYELSDQGLGYSPSGIHTMGHTQKRNPFLTGKNGEGLKLAAASAKKQGFDITFSSFGFDTGGQEVAWQAIAATVSEEFTHDKKTHTAERLVFDVQTHDREVLGERSAATTLVLPDTADSACQERWLAWMACIDPRSKDSYGNSGLHRHLLMLENPNETYDTVGPTTVLLRRPGQIFENGIQIRTEQQASRKFTLGWNFPSITSTRERTHIDEDMAKAYIRHYFANTKDEAAIEHLLKSIQVHEITENDMRFDAGPEFSQVTEVATRKQQQLDVSPDWALDNKSDYPALALFREKAKELYPGKMLFSYEVAKQQKMSMSGSLRHIREADRLNVSASDYAVLRHIFPTMEDYLNDVKSSIIDIDADSLEPLRTVVGEEIIRVEAALDRLEKDPKTSQILNYILKKSGTTRKQIGRRLNLLSPTVSAGSPTDVFLMADDSQADGLASDGIGLRMSLLDSTKAYRTGRMYGVIDHELTHKMLYAEDYTTEFLLLLALLAHDRLLSKNTKRIMEQLARLREGTTRNPTNEFAYFEKILRDAGLRITDIGLTEDEWQALKVETYKHDAIRTLEFIRTHKREYYWIDELFEKLQLANLTPLDIGTNEEELIAIKNEGLTFHIELLLTRLRHGDDAGYQATLVKLQKLIEQADKSSLTHGVTEAELQRLRVSNAKHAATQWLEFLRIDTLSARDYYENLREAMKDGNLKPEDIGSTLTEIIKFASDAEKPRM